MFVSSGAFCHCWDVKTAVYIVYGHIDLISRTSNIICVFPLTHVHAGLQNNLTNLVFTSHGNSM